jgi:hypothetical protein
VRSSSSKGQGRLPVPPNPSKPLFSGNVDCDESLGELSLVLAGLLLMVGEMRTATRAAATVLENFMVGVERKN